MSVRLFVGNLPYDVTEEELKQHFEQVGPLSYVYLPADRETGRLRGFAFIEFSEREQADEAVRRLNNQPLRGRPLTINEARARDASAPPRPRDGGPPPSRPGGGFSPRPPGPRPMGPRPSAWAPPEDGEAEARRGKTGGGRTFGPDAPAKKRKWEKSDKAPKGIRRRLDEKVRYSEIDDPDDDFDNFRGDNIAIKASDDDEGLE
ncbi:MAG: RNA recognition motif domain-containing protein [Acidobacteriota bacterium]